jgi:SAM-dependent methyltransferase
MDDISRYEHLHWWGPYSEAAIARMLPDALHNGDAIDLGCGRGALALHLSRARNMKVTAVDRSAASLALLARDAQESGMAGQLRPIQADATAWSPEAPVDFVGWLGGPYIKGDFPSTVATLATWLRPGGFLLLGEGFAVGPPHPTWQAIAGIPDGTFQTLDALHALVNRHDLRLVRAGTASRADWDHFETTVRDNLLASPVETPLRAERLRFIEAQLQWGRACLGMALMLVQKDAG